MKIQYRTKAAKGPHCGDCKKALQGVRCWMRGEGVAAAEPRFCVQRRRSASPAPPAQIPRLRPYAYKLLKKNQRTVSRPYGGSRCATCTRTRVLRAFIVEEAKEAKKASNSRA